MLLLDRHENVPITDIALIVQRCLDEGAVIVVITRNPDGRTCTISVQRG